MNPNVGRARYEIRCDPPAGSVPNPARTCAAIDDDPALVTDPKPFSCMGGPYSWWDIFISGRLHDRRVETHVETCWTRQMKLIDALELESGRPEAMLPRRTRTLDAGERATYARHELEPGDLVVCVARGKRLEQGIGFAAGPRYSGWGPPYVWMSVETRADGSVHAECDTPEAAPPKR